MNTERQPNLEAEAGEAEVERYANELTGRADREAGQFLRKLSEYGEKVGKGVAEILKGTMESSKRSLAIALSCIAMGGCASATQAEINTAMDEYGEKADNDEGRNEFPITLQINDSGLRDRIISALLESGNITNEEARRVMAERSGMETGLRINATGSVDEVTDTIARVLQEQE